MKNIYTGNNVVITGEVNLSEDVSIWHNAVLRGDEGYITIGSRTNIQDLVMIHTGMPDYSVTIGHDTIIGGNVWLTQDVPPYSRILQQKAVQSPFFSDGAGI